jgi:LuxR family maltose regulon positive regulatory protein
LLLKALLLAGTAGRQQHALAGQLWPDSEDAMTAMSTTVHRLRKLLGTDGAVTVTQGVVTLDSGTVWSGLSAFLLIVDRIDALSDLTPLSQLLHLQNAVCRLYRGPLCEGDTEGWIVSARDRYRNHLVTAATKLGARLEAMEAWSEANRVYLLARQAEPLVEVIHRALMRCAHHLEGAAGAADAYRRCHETLSLVLGSKPSIETVALAQAMGLERELQGSGLELPPQGKP